MYLAASLWVAVIVCQLKFVYPKLFLRCVSEYILFLGEPNYTRVLFSLGDWALLTKRTRFRRMLSHQPSNPSTTAA